MALPGPTITGPASLEVRNQGLTGSAAECHDADGAVLARLEPGGLGKTNAVIGDETVLIRRKSMFSNVQTAVGGSGETVVAGKGSLSIDGETWPLKFKRRSLPVPYVLGDPGPGELASLTHRGRAVVIEVNDGQSVPLLALLVATQYIRQAEKNSSAA